MLCPHCGKDTAIQTELATKAQLKVITLIETNLNEIFEGSTKQEAIEFIGEHIEASKQAMEHRTKRLEREKKDFHSYKYDSDGKHPHHDDLMDVYGHGEYGY